MNRSKYSSDSFVFFLGKSERNWSKTGNEPRFSIDFCASLEYEYKNPWPQRRQFDADPEDLKGLADFIYDFLEKEKNYLKISPWGVIKDSIDAKHDNVNIEYTHSIKIPNFIESRTADYSFKILKHNLGVEEFEAFSINIPENLLDDVDWMSYDFTKKELKLLADFIYEILGNELISRISTHWGVSV
jgi:hypothetical protein